MFNGTNHDSPQWNYQSAKTEFIVPPPLCGVGKIRRSKIGLWRTFRGWFWSPQNFLVRINWKLFLSDPPKIFYDKPFSYCKSCPSLCGNCKNEASKHDIGRLEILIKLWSFGYNPEQNYYLKKQNALGQRNFNRILAIICKTNKTGTCFAMSLSCHKGNERSTEVIVRKKSKLITAEKRKKTL